MNKLHHTPLSIFFLSIILVTLLFAQDKSEQKPCEELDRLARDLSVRGEKQEAIEVYNEILKEYPKDIDCCINALESQGRCYTFLGEFNTAIQTYEKMLDRYSTDTTVLNSKSGWPADVYVKWSVPFFIGKIYIEMDLLSQAKNEIEKGRGFADYILADKTLNPQRRSLYKLNYTIYSDALIELYHKEGNMSAAAKEYEKEISFIRNYLVNDEVANLPPLCNKENVKTILMSVKDIQYPLRLAEIYEKMGENKRAKELYQQIDQAVAVALQTKKYEERMKPFHDYLPEIQEKVRDKLRRN